MSSSSDFERVVGKVAEKLGVAVYHTAEPVEEGGSE